MNEKKPFFSVIVPLYNKQNHVKDTIKSVLEQSFKDFEIVVVNDGSTDESMKVAESIEDNRIRLITQENAGVSVARNRGIQEAKADYMVFLDADDIWLPEFLQTIHELIQKFPNAGLYATAFRKRKMNGEEIGINIQGLPSENYTGVLPNYFKSIVQGETLVCASAVCIPKTLLIRDNIWFPSGEKYGEDQYIWARMAMEYDMIYTTKECAIYLVEAENNTKEATKKERDPHKSILMLKDYRDSIKDENKMKDFDKYIEKHIVSFVSVNMQRSDKLYGLKQVFIYKLSMKYKLKYLLMFITPQSSYNLLKKLRSKVQLFK